MNQIRSKAEKDKIKEDEFKEEERLRRQQFELAKQFEDEIALQKSIAEEKNRMELAKQIEDKKRQKEIETEKQRLLYF